MQPRTCTFSVSNAPQPIQVCFSCLELERAVYLYIGMGEAPALLGSVFAAAPGAAKSAQEGGVPQQQLPASSSLLLDGGNPSVDQTEADFFSAQLSAGTGKLVLLSFNVNPDLMDGVGCLEIKKRALAFLQQPQVD